MQILKYYSPPLPNVAYPQATARKELESLHPRHGVWNVLRNIFPMWILHPPNNRPYKMSYLPTWKLLKILLHLELTQCKWDENLTMVDKIAYPTLSSSPLKISAKCFMILGCNNVALNWQEES